MIKKIFMSIALAIAASTCFASEESQKLEFTLVSVTDRIVVGKELPNIAQGESVKRLYVVVEGNWGKVYKQTTKTTQDMFRKQGLSLVEKRSEADIVVAIKGTSFDMDEVETNIDAGINKGRVAEVVGGAILTGGVSLIGEMWRPSSGNAKAVVISATFIEQTKVDGSEKINEKFSVVSSNIVYQASKDGTETANAVYLAFVDKLLENHFPSAKQTTSSAEAQPVSQAPTATPATSTPN